MQEEKSVKTELSVKPHTSRSAKTSKPKKSIFINKRAVVCEDIVLEGEIRIGEGTVLHPQCKILAEQGPIVIGQNNIIEEKVTIVNRQQKPLLIGDENVFEVGSYIEGTKIGNKNIIEAKARIMGTTSLGNNCVIGAVCSTRNDENIPDNTVIYGDYHNRRTQTNGSNASVHTRHLDYLREVLPKCNYIKVSEKPKDRGSAREPSSGHREARSVKKIHS
ncbi:6009_t:CDS:10 [Ambispora gerdemannii]|uniref:Dynactin subunit 6 n=1 Tax=Ambispora gerdemannii TaxID=144530 RepID=A0A9N8ZZ59_9GLOM|nr:6009_t:CDS:10 [Ambispora gerdemannii]